MVTRSALPQNWTTRASDVVIEDFSGNISGWTKSGTGNISMDASVFHTGTQSLKMEATTAGTYVQATNDVHVSLIPGNYEMWFWVDDPAKFVSFTVYLMDGTYINSYAYIVLSTRWIPGWNHFIISPGDWLPDGNYTWRSELRHLRLRVTPAAGQVGSMYFDSITAGREGIGSVVFIFDDGYASMYDNAFPMFQAAGLKFNTAIISDSVGDAGFCTVAQLQEMYAAGMGIMNHTKSHLNLTTLTDAEVQANVSDCTNFLLSNGMHRDAYHLVYPGNHFDAAVIASCQAVGILSARCGTPGYNFAGTGHYLSLAIFSQMESAQIVALVRTALRNAQVSGCTAVFMGHDVLDSGGETPISLANMQLVLNEVLASHVQCLTIGEWYNGLTNPRYRSLPIGRS